MVSKKFIIKDVNGIHMRPARIFCETALTFTSSIQILVRTTTANAKSLLNILGAGVKCEDEIEIVCEGVDEKEALETLERVILDMNQEATNATVK